MPREPLVASPRLVGDDVRVPLVTGGDAPYLNLDYAASAPALREVLDAVEEFLPWYSSVHRGAGFKSVVSTRTYERARERVAAFVGCRADDTVVFTRNTTDALNLLASALPEGARVVVFDTEHHANLLPWRRHDVTCLHTPATPDELGPALDDALRGLGEGPALVTVTGASNVTGEVWPVAELAAVAHRHGAYIAVDAAQLAPHAPIDIASWDVDWVAISGHKMYAPFGAGALAGRREWLGEAEPFLAGGGAVRFVTVDDVAWADLPDRQEAGSPNVVGALALGVACEALSRIGMAHVAAEENALAAYARSKLAAIPGLETYGLWPRDHPHIGVVTFTLAGYHHSELAAILSAEHGIAVRDGCFCAHPLLIRLLGVSEKEAARVRDDMIAGRMKDVPGAVRISGGIATTHADIDRAVAAIRVTASDGPRWRYAYSEEAQSFLPDPDPRPLPDLR